MRLMLSLSPVTPPARLATTAKAPLDATSSTIGRTPAVMSRLVYSTFAPSIESTEILWSLLRETSALLPSGVIATMPPPALAPPTSTVPAGVTVLPWMVKTDTVAETSGDERARALSGHRDFGGAHARVARVDVMCGVLGESDHCVKV